MIAILGASGTIGSALARRLVRSGRNVLLVGRNGEKLAQLSAELGQPTETIDAAHSQSLIDTKQRVTDAQLRLENWLKTHCEEYESAGPLRVMGYNSPFVADKKRFTEVQIPVRTKQSAKANVR